MGIYKIDERGFYLDKKIAKIYITCVLTKENAIKDDTEYMKYKIQRKENLRKNFS